MISEVEVEEGKTVRDKYNEGVENLCSAIFDISVEDFRLMKQVGHTVLSVSKNDVAAKKIIVEGIRKFQETLNIQSTTENDPQEEQTAKTQPLRKSMLEAFSVR